MPPGFAREESEYARPSRSSLRTYPIQLLSSLQRYLLTNHQIPRAVLRAIINFLHSLHRLAAFAMSSRGHSHSCELVQVEHGACLDVQLRVYFIIVVGVVQVFTADECVGTG